MILEENSYLFFLFLLPVLILLFLWMQNWKKKAISTFGDAQLVEKLAPKKSFLKEVIKTILFLTSITLPFCISFKKAFAKRNHKIGFRRKPTSGNSAFQ